MDRYTKAILTVIAVCLVIQTAKDVAFVEPAHADQIHKIAICRPDGSLCVGVDDGYDDGAGNGRFINRK